MRYAARGLLLLVLLCIVSGCGRAPSTKQAQQRPSMNYGDAHYPKLPREVAGGVYGTISVLAEANDRKEIQRWAQRHRLPPDVVLLSSQDPKADWITVRYGTTSGAATWRIHLYANAPVRPHDPRPWKLLFIGGRALEGASPEEIACASIDGKAKALVFADQKGKVFARIPIKSEIEFVQHRLRSFGNRARERPEERSPGRNRRQDRQQATGSRKALPVKHPRLLRVAVYRSPGYTGHTTVSLTDGRLVGLSRGLASLLNGRPGQWGELKSSLSDMELKNVLGLADKRELRAFQPESSWFGACRSFDVGCDVVLTWSDREVVYGIPPQHMRGALPQKAKAVYLALDAVISYVHGLEFDYKHTYTSRIRLVSARGSEVEQFHKRLEQVRRKSLPAKQVGW